MPRADVPWDSALPLSIEPQLASWNRAGDPAQVRLAAYLDHVEELLAPALVGTADAPLGLGLTVGVSPAVPLEDQRDLDNYLKPLIDRLGARRFTTVVGRKIRGASSVLVFRPSGTPAGNGMVRLRPSGSYMRREWKAGMETALTDQGAAVLPPGGVHLDIRYTVGAGRNWSALWKPTIDALTPLLGTSHPGTYNPHDGRVTYLSCHQQVVPDLGHDVLIDLWWGPSPG